VARGVIPNILRTIADSSEAIIIIAMLVLGDALAAILGGWHVAILLRRMIVL
jgi:hypothetical protein